MFQLCLLLALIVTGYTKDIRQKLEFPPPPVNGFNLHAFVGQWFIQFRKPPCSWSGSSLFTDFEQTITPGRNGYLHVTYTWRSHGTCNKGTGKNLIDGPGVFNYIDNVGDISSGRVIVAGTDYKTFLIQWACTKMAVLGDRCEDPWIIVATRQLFPSPIVVGIIETILRTRWGISSGELPKVPHNAPCKQKFPNSC